jgi:calcium-dependent protein kinase
MAPEVYNSNYDEKCDIWSCGVILYKLLSGRFPFEADDEISLRQKVFKGEFDLQSTAWTKTTKECRDLLEKMLKVKPSERCSAKYVINHDWMKHNSVEK